MATAFTPQERDLLVKAMDTAWKHLAETGQAKDETLVKAALSRAILEAADRGERALQLLVAYALAHLEKAKAEIRDRVTSGL